MNVERTTRNFTVVWLIYKDDQIVGVYDPQQKSKFDDESVYTLWGLPSQEIQRLSAFIDANRRVLDDVRGGRTFQWGGYTFKFIVFPWAEERDLG